MKVSYWIIIVLILIGGFYRFYDLGHDSYWIDESYTVLAAKNIGTYGYPAFDSGVSYISALPQEYLLFIIGSVFGYSEIPMRLLSVIAGMVLIWAVFLLARKFHDEITALIASGLVTFSYFVIAWSRQARMYIFIALFAVLAVYYYFKFLEKPNWKDFGLLFLFLFLGYVTHPSILIVLAAMLVHYVSVKKKTLFSDLKNLYSKNKKMFMLILLIVVIVAISFIIRTLSGLELIRNYSAAYENFLLSSQYTILFFAVIGLFGFKNKLIKNSLYFIVLLLAYILASFFVPYLNYRYLFVALPFLFILCSEGIMYIISLYKSISYKVAASFVIIVIFVVSGFFVLPQSHYALEVGTPQPPFRDAYAYVNALEYSTLIVTQPAIAELYVGKADYWLAISYENRVETIMYLYNSTTGVERYSGIQTIDSLDKLRSISDFVLVIDDMGLQRLSTDMRDFVLNLTLVETFGYTYWNTVHVYRKL